MAQPPRRAACSPDRCGVRDRLFLWDLVLFEACLGRKAQEALWRGGGYRVAGGDSWVLGAQSSRPQLGAGSGLGSGGCEEGALLRRGALASVRGCAGVAARTQAGGERVSPCSCLSALAAFRGTDVSAETSFPSAKKRAGGCSSQPTIA